MEKMLQQIYVMMANGEFANADAYCNQVLEADPQNYAAHVAKLMIERRACRVEQLANGELPLDESVHFQKLMEYGNQGLNKDLIEYNRQIRARNSEDMYCFAVALMSQNMYETYIKAREIFVSIANYKDSAVLAEKCANLAKGFQKSEEETNDRPIEIFEEGVKPQKKKSALGVAMIISLGMVVIAALILLIVLFMHKNPSEESVPVEPFEMLTLKEDVSAGGHHSVALKRDGTAVAVGNNEKGQCDIESWTDIADIEAGAWHTVGLRNDGTVVVAGANDGGECDVAEWERIVDVAAGGLHTVGVKSDGSVLAVGSNSSGQCNVDKWSDIEEVVAGGSHTVGLKSDGTVVAVGNNEYGQCDVSGWTDIAEISAGEWHTVGVKKDGTVVAVGYNGSGRCDVEGITDAVAVAAGGFHTIVLKSDGTVVNIGWDADNQGDVYDWEGVSAVAAGMWHTVAIKNDGTVVATGRSEFDRCETEGWDLF